MHHPSARRLHDLVWLPLMALLFVPCAAAAPTGGTLVRGSLLGVLVLVAAGLVWALRRNPVRNRRIEATFLEHLEELRRRIMTSFLAVVAGTAFAFSFRIQWHGSWPLPVPDVQDNLSAQFFRVLSGALVPDSVQLVTTRPMDGIMAEMWISFGLGFALALPVVLWQGARFFGPALEARERRALAHYILPVLALFLLGAAFCLRYVLPFLFTTLYGYSDALDARLFLSVQDFVTFSFGMMLVFGVAFQTPIIMYALARVGLTTASFYLRFWRHALVAILVVSAIVTDPTVVSQIMVAVPLFGLYLFGIALAAFAGKARRSGGVNPASR